MALPNIWNRVQGLLFGGAIGAAMSKSLEAVLEPVRQKAWQANQFRLLDPRTLAELAARGFSKLSDLDDEASRNGYDANRLAALYALAQRYPGLGELDDLSNRGLIGPDQVKRVLSRHGYGEEWVDPFMALFNDLLSPVEVANAVQQGHLPNDGILPDVSTEQNYPPGYTEPHAPDGHPPTEVPLTQIDLPPIKEAAGGGVDEQRLKVLANLSGLPPPQGELLQMLNRGIITQETFDAGVREGHTKTKWIGAVKRMRWAVIPAREASEAWLRDWITEQEAKAIGAQTGYTADQMDLLYKNRGRTATPRQLWLAIARKVGAPDYPDLPAGGRLTDFTDHERAIRRSNIQPWYAKLLYDIRYNYPPLFQLGRLVQAGAITPELAGTWASYNLEAPEVVDALTKYWQTIYPGAPGSAKSPTTPPEVKSQITALITATRKAYVGTAVTQPQAATALDVAAITPASQAEIFKLWDAQRVIEETRPTS